MALPMPDAAPVTSAIGWPAAWAWASAAAWPPQRPVLDPGTSPDLVDRRVPGKARGELRSGLDPRLAAFVFYGALEEILTGWLLGELDADVAEAERAVVDIVCGGLDPAPVPV